MSNKLSTTFKNTKNNILRNKWLSMATILVTTIVFASAAIFTIAALLARRAVDVTEKEAQMQIYFVLDAPESEIFAVEELVKSAGQIEKIEYIDQQKALKYYISYYSEEEDLTEGVDSEWLPASLTVRAETLTDLDNITAVIKEESKTNPYIDDVLYHEDVVNQLKMISKAITVGGLAVIGLFTFITLALVIITVSFNITAHKSEIQIMHLVGSSDSYVKTPFILEGVFATVVGAFIAASLIIIPWYLFMYTAEGSNFYFVITDTLSYLSLQGLGQFNLIFVLIFYGILILIGGIIGFISSYIATAKYLKLKEK
ncbi:MAG: permease-like cell division protein FtsX [Candidatus Dojkabacteria bacterium]|nr:MAG: permease-like cell division protein FtsX [Candidatus Dojkabacteria bacterium]